jgi:hypothetical protein
MEEINNEIPTQPFPSWTFDGTHWQPPVPTPQEQFFFKWDEETQSWIKVI